MEGDFEGDYKGDFRGDFTQNLEGDLLSSSGQVQVVKCEPNGHHGCGSKMFVLITQQDEDDEYNGPRQIWHNWTDFYGFNSVLDSRSMY